MPKDGILESFPWYLDDWWNDDTAMELPPPARLLYLETLFVASKFGFVPKSFRSCSQKVHLPEKFVARNWPKVQPFFYETESGWAHHKVDEVRAKKLQTSSVKSIAGAAGAAARAKHMPEPENQHMPEPENQHMLSSRARSPSPYINIDNRSNNFQADAERFDREYPQAISDLDMQNFLSQVRSEVDQELFFHVLAANNQTEKWQKGFSPGASKYLTTGLWRKMPKESANAKNSPDYQPRWMRELLEEEQAGGKP